MRLFFLLASQTSTSAGPLLTVSPLFRRVISPRPGWNLRYVHRLIRELNIVVHPFRPRGLQPVAVIPLRKIRLVMRAARLVAAPSANRDYPRENQQLAQLPRKVQRLIRPPRAIT